MTDRKGVDVFEDKTSWIILADLQAIEFWDQVDMRGPGECWLMKAQPPGSLRRPRTSIPARIHQQSTSAVAYSAARAALALHLGRIVKPRLQVDHLCFNPPCVNPAHLEAVSALENNHRRRDYQRRLRETI